MAPLLLDRVGECMAENPKALPIFQKAYDFAKWMLAHTSKFPKSHRFSVAVRMENLCVEMLENIYAARQRETRLQSLMKADSILGRLKIFMRLSMEMKFLSFGSYEFAVANLDELGKMLGGWIKKERDLPPSP